MDILTRKKFVKCWSRILWSLLLVLCNAGISQGDPPNPVLNTVYPPGARAGEVIEVEIAGSGLDGLSALYCDIPGIQIEQLEKNKNRFSIHVAKLTPPGFYDLRAVCQNGLSSPRPFVIGTRSELLENEPNDSSDSFQNIALNSTINGRIEKGGDVDYFRFTANQGQRIVIECVAERIDSMLRPILEVFDLRGRTLASNRGYFGTDPLIDFQVPADGEYSIRLHDLIYAGSLEHYYRLDVDTGPRLAFCHPSVIERGHRGEVSLYGWNLTKNPNDVTPGALDRIEIKTDAELTPMWPLPVRMQPAQAPLEFAPISVPGCHRPVLIGLTDVPVIVEASENHSANTAQLIVYPCEVSGRLVAGNEQDWYEIAARRGEVLYIEGFAHRIHSPIDLDIRIIDQTSRRELLKLGDEVQNVGGSAFPTAHLDPSGRWLVPRDGRYVILVRNVIGGQAEDPRRVYRLSVRREEPDVRLTIIPQRLGPSGVNVARGGRTIVDVLAFRRRGLTGSIRVFAEELPRGVHCSDVWLGPGVHRTKLVISADDDAPNHVGELRLKGSTASTTPNDVRGGVIVRSGMPSGWGRLTSEIPLAVAGVAPVRITANGHEARNHHLYGDLQVRHSPGSIVDVAIEIERTDQNHQAPVKLIGVGLPNLIENQTAIIPHDNHKGYISFYLPPSLPTGKYSLAVRGETTVSTANKKTETIRVVSNIVTLEVQPAAFRVDVDPYAPRQIKRGEVVQVGYSVRRINGFINKIHTELAMPGKVTEVVGLRGRGVTFVGQTEQGTIQIIANDDAPFGQQPFLRLYAVGVLEDKPIFQGSCYLNLKVVE